MNLSPLSRTKLSCVNTYLHLPKRKINPHAENSQRTIENLIHVHRLFPEHFKNHCQRTGNGSTMTKFSITIVNLVNVHEIILRTVSNSLSADENCIHVDEILREP
jgi:hypothetical protein